MPSYVMVPVPEDLVEDVMQFILQTAARGSMVPWSDETLGKFYMEIDEAGRSLVSYVARASADGKGLADNDAAAMMEISLREVTGLMREINEQARAIDHPHLIGNRTVTEILPSGRTAEKRLFTMKEEIMVLVLNAERADRLANPLPVLNDQG